MRICYFPTLKKTSFRHTVILSHLCTKLLKGAAISLLLVSSPHGSGFLPQPFMRLVLSSHRVKTSPLLNSMIGSEFSPCLTISSSDHSLLFRTFSFGSWVTSISWFSSYLIVCIFSIPSTCSSSLQLIKAVTCQF